jgi:hypothetical protein
MVGAAAKAFHAQGRCIASTRSASRMAFLGGPLRTLCSRAAFAAICTPFAWCRLAGPVSFFGFMLLGPAVLMVLRVYLQIYVEHSNRLDRLAQLMPLMRAPLLVPLQNPLIRFFSALIFYLLLPVTMMLFAWKAAVFPAGGTALSAVAVAVIVGHVMLPLGRFTWRSKARLSAGAAALAWGLIFASGPLSRPFDLYHADLSGESLMGDDLHNANLIGANLKGAILGSADLSGADLTGANLEGADLSFATLIRSKLSEARLREADLSNADLGGAYLSGANLSGANLSRAALDHADLSGAKNLTQAQLDGAAAPTHSQSRLRNSH